MIDTDILSNQMKQLLGMAREKKEKEVPKPIGLQKKLIQPQFQPPSESEHEYDEEEMGEEQLLGYAQFLGIKLPEEEDLLWIAEEGLFAELPTGWIAEETEEDGEIMYINTKTGERTYQHPCDEYYQQLVVQERKKRGNKLQGAAKKGPMMQMNQKFPAQSQAPVIVQPQPKQIVTDPLVKMQQEKELKKLEEQKKKEFEEKKQRIKEKHDTKKEDLQRELKEKEDKLSRKYQEDINAEKEKEMKKMSEKEREAEEKMNRELMSYEAEARAKAEKAAEEKRKREKENLDAKMRQKKEEIKKEIQAQLKKAKKEVDNEFREKLRILEEKQKKTVNDTQQLDNMLENEIKNMKNEIIRKKMKEHAERLRAENERQKEQYAKEVQQMQLAHEKRIVEIQTKEPKNKIKMEELIKECERQEEEELQAFRYELQHLKKARQFENEEKLQEFRYQLEEEHKRAIAQLLRDYNIIYEKYRNLKNQEYESYIWEAERKSKEEYLRSLKSLEKKFNTEEEIVIIQNAEESNGVMEKESLSKMSSMLEQLGWEEKEQRRELQSVKLEIENLRSQNISFGGKLNNNQMKLYQLIQDKIKSKPGQQ